MQVTTIHNIRIIGKLCVFLWLCILFGPLTAFSQITPKVSSKADTTFIKIGEQIKFTVTVEAFKTDTTRNKDSMTL